MQLHNCLFFFRRFFPFPTRDPPPGTLAPLCAPLRAPQLAPSQSLHPAEHHAAQKHPVAPPPEQMCFGWKWLKPRGSGAIPILLRCKANPSNGLKIISVGLIMAITVNVVRDGPPWWYLFTAYSQRATPCCIIQINKVCLDVRQGGRWSVLKQNVCTWVLQINLSVCLHQSAKTLKPFAANPK